MSVSTAPQDHAVLHGISWETYERLLDELQNRRLRLTYDRGALEIMSPSRSHERVKWMLARMIETMTEELGIEIEGGGSTTWRRKDLEKGLEPDECYWIQNEEKVRGRMELDLRLDPPPDLALEVDVHAQCLDRLVIYGALGVAEVWRWVDGRIEVHLRQSDGSYRQQGRSSCFPWLPMQELTRWLGRSDGQPGTSFIRAFRAWVRESVRPA